MAFTDSRSPLNYRPMTPPGVSEAYGNRFKTGGANYQPGRTLPVGQIMAQRTNAQAARYADGSPVPKGMPINVA
jgi:hypothetical protein